ncbi:hypothetical protein TIFTF001_007115 [Ficus carica]|uniref:Uncharacterized protein n=1 Tax=Ficus carica TaxID=3494 RepID=A0AA88CZC3_FICCA|nr:hypothetical protein TIFTF001_007115 [Ficus carica]
MRQLAKSPHVDSQEQIIREERQQKIKVYPFQIEIVKLQIEKRNIPIKEHDIITETCKDQNFLGKFPTIPKKRNQERKFCGDLGEAKERRREGRRGGAARFGGRRRGREVADRGEEALAADMSGRDRDPAERQAMVVAVAVAAKRKSEARAFARV